MSLIDKASSEQTLKEVRELAVWISRALVLKLEQVSPRALIKTQTLAPFSEFTVQQFW